MNLVEKYDNKEFSVWDELLSFKLWNKVFEKNSN